MSSLFCNRGVLLALSLLFGLTSAAVYADGGKSGKAIGNSSPAGIGGDGPWDRENMILVSRLTLSEIGSGGASNVLANDCWGWTDPQDGTEYAICGLTNGTSFIDISDPGNPIYLGKLPTQTGNAAWRDMKVYANHCYIVSDGNGDHGMQVFDLTQLRTASRTTPTTFSNTAWYDGGIGSAHNVAINEDTGFAYIVGSGRASGGLHVVDLSNPTQPVEAGVDAVQIQRIRCAEPLPVNAYQLINGDLVSGSINELNDSDDQRLVFKTPRRFGPGIIVEMDFTSPTETPSLLRLNVESMVNRTNRPVAQSIQLYDFDQGQFEEIDLRDLHDSQEIAMTVAANGDLSRFVESGTGRVVVRFHLKKNQQFVIGAFRALFDVVQLEVLD